MVEGRVGKPVCPFCYFWSSDCCAVALRPARFEAGLAPQSQRPGPTLLDAADCENPLMARCFVTVEGQTMEVDAGISSARSSRTMPTSEQGRRTTEPSRNGKTIHQ
jgi:hypothetical protein